MTVSMFDHLFHQTKWITNVWLILCSLYYIILNNFLFYSLEYENSQQFAEQMKQFPLKFFNASASIVMLIDFVDVLQIRKPRE